MNKKLVIFGAGIGGLSMIKELSHPQAKSPRNISTAITFAGATS